MMNPIGKNDGKNEGGVVLYVQSGSYGRQEVSRVGWIRRNTKNPDVSFEAQLKAEVAKAKQAISEMNELVSAAGVLQ